MRLSTGLIVIVKEFIKKDESKKTFNSIKSLSLFVLVWGFFWLTNWFNWCF